MFFNITSCHPIALILSASVENHLQANKNWSGGTIGTESYYKIECITFPIISS